MTAVLIRFPSFLLVEVSEEEPTIVLSPGVGSSFDPAVFFFELIAR